MSDETFLINTQQWEKHLAFSFYTWLLQKVRSDMKKANDTVNEIMFPWPLLYKAALSIRV